MPFPGHSPSAVYILACPPSICASPGRAEYNSTRRPALASVPARWKQVDVLPTPLLQFRATITDIVPSFPVHGGPPQASDRDGVRNSLSRSHGGPGSFSLGGTHALEL